MQQSEHAEPSLVPLNVILGRPSAEVLAPLVEGEGAAVEAVEFLHDQSAVGACGLWARAMLGSQQVGDQVPAEDGERVDTEKAAGQPGGADVVHDDAYDGHRPDAVEPVQIGRAGGGGLMGGGESRHEGLAVPYVGPGVHHEGALLLSECAKPAWLCIGRLSVSGGFVPRPPHAEAAIKESAPVRAARAALAK